MSKQKRLISVAKLKKVVSKLIRYDNPTLPSVAMRLGISARSLQRQLEIQDITYSKFVEEMRYEVAQSLLAGTGLDIAEIGASLGYRDPSSFSRAFMRWSGMSPSEYRGSHAPAKLSTS